MPIISDLLAEVEPVVEQLEEEPTVFEPEQLIAGSSASEMTGLSLEMDKGDGQLVLPRDTVESAIPLTMTITDKPISEEPIQLELVPDEPMHDENVEIGKVQEGPTHEEQEKEVLVPSQKEQLQFAELPLFDEIAHLSPVKGCAIEATPFEGRASS